MMKNIFYVSLLICVTNAQAHYNQTLFANAIKDGNLEQAQKIWAEGGIDINGSVTEEVYSVYTALGGFDVIKKSYLYLAIQKSEALAQFLLEKGANPNIAFEGRWPLVAAIDSAKKSMIELLLQKGAIPSDAIINCAREKQPALVPLLESARKSKL
jgi:hypothetical protein